jgi:hypothetical protein
LPAGVKVFLLYLSRFLFYGLREVKSGKAGLRKRKFVIFKTSVATTFEP